MTTPTRRITSAFTLAALACLVMAAPALGQTDRPALWSGEAGAAGLRLFLTTEPAAVPVPTLLDLRVPDGHSVWESSGVAMGRASSVYPGAAGIGGIQLLCDFGAPCPDQTQQLKWPFTAFAEHPTQPDAETRTGFGKTHAGRDFVATTAQFGNVLPLDALADVVAIGAGSSVTRQEFGDDGALVVRARTTLTDVVIGGGALTIDEVELVATSRADGGKAVSDSRVTLVGLRTAEGDVLVGDRGLTIGGEGGGQEAIDQLNAALEQALADSGVSAQLVGVTRTEGAERTRAEATGLAIGLAREVSGPALQGADRLYRTYVARLILGDVSTSAFATNAAFSISNAGLADLPGLSSETSSSGEVGTAGGFATTGDRGSDSALGRGMSTAPSVPSRSAPTSTSPSSDDATSPAVAPQSGAPSAGQNAGFALLSGDAARAVSGGYGAVVFAVVGLIGASRVAGRRFGERDLR